MSIEAEAFAAQGKESKGKSQGGRRVGWLPPGGQ